MLIPTDGIVKTTATQITGGADTDLEKARTIYEWVVDNTFRSPKTRGCGVDDIRWMLESRILVVNAPISTHCTLALLARLVFRRATSTAFASLSQSWAARALELP